MLCYTFIIVVISQIWYTLRHGAIVLQGGWPSFLYGMEVMLMKHFDFKDLMAFGMFILALLTFVYTICK